MDPMLGGGRVNVFGFTRRNSITPVEHGKAPVEFWTS
jgi:hypothetical protein